MNVTERCSKCGYLMGHAWGCQNAPDIKSATSNEYLFQQSEDPGDVELHPAGTRAELARLRERVAALEGELHSAHNATQIAMLRGDVARQETDQLRDILNRVYAERDNARDDAAGLREQLDAAKRLIERNLTPTMLFGPGNAPLPFEETPAPVSDHTPSGLDPLDATKARADYSEQLARGRALVSACSAQHKDD